MPTPKPPSLHSLPPDALSLISQHLAHQAPSPAPLPCRATLTSLTSLLSLLSSLPSPPRCPLPAVRACALCAATPLAAPAALARLLRLLRPREFRAPPTGWARRGLCFLLAVLAEEAAGLVVLDLAAVELRGAGQEAALRTLLQALCAAARAGLGGRRRVALWAGEAWVVGCLVGVEGLLEEALEGLELVALPPGRGRRGEELVGEEEREEEEEEEAYYEQVRKLGKLGNTGPGRASNIRDLRLKSRERRRRGPFFGFGMDADMHDGAQLLDGGGGTGGAVGDFLSSRLFLVEPFHCGLKSLSLASPSMVSQLLRFIRSGGAASLEELSLSGARRAAPLTPSAADELVAAAPELRRVALRDCVIAQRGLGRLFTALAGRLVEFLGCWEWRRAVEMRHLVGCAGRLEKFEVAVCERAEEEWDVADWDNDGFYDAFAVAQGGEGGGVGGAWGGGGAMEEEEQEGVGLHLPVQNGNGQDMGGAPPVGQGLLAWGGGLGGAIHHVALAADQGVAAAQEFLLQQEGLVAMQVEEHNLAAPVAERIGKLTVSCCSAWEQSLTELHLSGDLGMEQICNAAAAAPHLKTLVLRFREAPSPGVAFRALLSRTPQLESLSILPQRRVPWRISLDAFLRLLAALAGEQCTQLETLHLPFPAFRDERDSLPAWRALDRLQEVAPRFCTARLRARLFHPYGKARPHVDSIFG